MGTQSLTESRLFVYSWKTISDENYDFSVVFFLSFTFSGVLFVPHPRLILIFFSIFIFQYNLDFNVLANRAGREQFRDGDDGSGVGGVGSDGKMNSGSGSDASMWQFGMARRSKGDGRRTRVSFLLFWAIRIRKLSSRSNVRLPFLLYQKTKNNEQGFLCKNQLKRAKRKRKKKGRETKEWRRLNL